MTTATGTPQTVAWHGNPALKANTVARMETHRAADEFIQGAYARLDPLADAQYLGCFHGCLTIEALAAERGTAPVDVARDYASISFHAEAERLFGIPRTLGVVLDRVFEEQPGFTEAAEFAVNATAAIQVGVDLSNVVACWVLDIIGDEEMGVWRHTAEGSPQRAAVDTVIGLYQRKLAGGTITSGEWRAARDAAEAAGGFGGAASYAAAAAAAACVVHATHVSVYTVYTAAAAHASVDGRKAHRVWSTSRLLAHIGAAPVPA